MIDYTARLELLRSKFSSYGIKGFIVPSTDPFYNEFVPECFKRLEYLTGFKGSFGISVVLENKAAFFTDGRYTLQANSEVNSSCYEIFNIAELKPWEWLRDYISLEDDAIIGFDPWLHTESNIKSYNNHGIALKALSSNVVDDIWLDRDSSVLSDKKIFIHEEKFSGQSSNDKRKLISKEIDSLGSDLFIITSPASICWLLNIRGNYIANNPLVLCYAIIYKDASVDLFINNDSSISKEVKDWFGKDIRVYTFANLEDICRSFVNKKIILDKSNSSLWFSNVVSGFNVIDKKDLCSIPKACKNRVEIDNFYYAQELDTKAMLGFLNWFEYNVNKIEMTELSIERKLLEFRKQNKEFVEPSFDTICGFNSNGAIVHYKASEKSNKKVKGNGLLLIDSGAQYHYGTTDITRTIAVGNVTKEQIHSFTLVLKGHIAIATAVFPKGTKGVHLDVLARQFLWNDLLDYQHGTGHGVGSFLAVHEGPQSISKALIDQELLPGMIISNEPGYYKEGEYGIRIENLVLVKEMQNTNKGKNIFYFFETITKVPIDMRLVDISMLNNKEINWLQEYHESIS